MKTSGLMRTDSDSDQVGRGPSRGGGGRGLVLIKYTGTKCQFKVALWSKAKMDNSSRPHGSSFNKGGECR